MFGNPSRMPHGCTPPTRTRPTNDLADNYIVDNLFVDDANVVVDSLGAEADVGVHLEAFGHNIDSKMSTDDR